MQEYLGWRKLAERGEEKKELFGKRLKGMDESQLVKAVVKKLREDGGIGWREEYEVLRRKFEVDNESGSEGKLKIKIKARNVKDWKKKYIRKAN